MQFFELNGRRYARFEHLGDEAGVAHAFSLKPLDVSPRHGTAAARQREQMLADLGLAGRGLAYCEQVHETRIARVDTLRAHTPLAGYDAAITDLPAAALMTFSADCPLILIHDPRRRAIGLAHASWRCTVAGLAGRMVGALREHFGCRPEDLRAGVGPGAGPCCYEVGEDVFSAAASLPQRDRLFIHRDGRLVFDLWAANRAQLLAAGLDGGRVEIAGICTLCRNDLFYSFRREGAGCGLFGLLAALTRTDAGG
jgi:YfiH family protein